jgi:hypothetical protein
MMWHRITHLDRGERLDRLCPDGHRSFEDPALWATEGRSLVAVINACGRMT